MVASCATSCFTCSPSSKADIGGSHRAPGSKPFAVARLGSLGLWIEELRKLIARRRAARGGDEDLTHYVL
jgi:hypothetical protein